MENNTLNTPHATSSTTDAPMPIKQPTSSSASKSFESAVQAVIQQYMKSGAFTDRKLTDTPTDALMVVNRKYVTLNGTVRPTSSVVGQQFIDMTLAGGRGKPIYWNNTGWIDANGSYV